MVIPNEKDTACTYVEQTLEIVRRYDIPQYANSGNRESDIFLGSIFVYEMLKLGLPADRVRNMLSSHKGELSREAGLMLDEIVRAAVSDLLESGVMNFITK